MEKKVNNVKLSASVMCADLANLELECLRLEIANIDRIHFDIMDGMFVDNIELGFSLLETLRKISDLPFECHLMVSKPEKYIDILLGLGIEYICVHLEATKKMQSIINKVIKSKSRIGIVVNPDSRIDSLIPLLQYIDQVCFMTVSPGHAGQTFKSNVLKKIKEIKNIIKREGYKIEIEADGNMSKRTIPEVVKCGVDILVLGSSSLFTKKQQLFKYKTIINEIRRWADR